MKTETMESILQDLLRQENPYDFEVQCVIAAGHGVDADAVGAVAKANWAQIDRQVQYLKSRKTRTFEKVDKFPKISDAQHRKEVRDLQAAAQLAGVAFTSPEQLEALRNHPKCKFVGHRVPCNLNEDYKMRGGV
jgi:hypothetical protein